MGISPLIRSTSMRRRRPREILRTMVAGDGAGGSWFDATGEDPGLWRAGGSNQLDPQHAFWDNFQQVFPGLVNLRGIAADLPRENLISQLPAGPQNASAEIDETAGDHTASNGVISVVDTDHVHGLKCFKLVATDAAPSMAIDVSAVTVGSQYGTYYLAQRMAKAPAGRTIRMDITTNSFSANLDYAATGDWQLVWVIKQMFTGEADIIHSCQLTDGEAGDVMLADDIMYGATTTLAPSVFCEDTANVYLGMIPLSGLLTPGQEFSFILLVNHREASGCNFVESYGENLDGICIGLESSGRYHFEVADNNGSDAKHVVGPEAVPGVPAAFTGSRDASGRLMIGVGGEAHIYEHSDGGTSETMYQLPQGLATDGSFLYVSDQNGNCLKKRSLADLGHIETIGPEVGEDDSLALPEGIAVDASNIYIADFDNLRILVLDKADHGYVGEIVAWGDPEDSFSGPWDVAVDATHVYVLDSDGSRIVKFLKADLSYVAEVGSEGSGDDQFSYPQALTLDDTYVYVADSGNSRIVKRLKSDLTYVAQASVFGIVTTEDLKDIVVGGSYLYATDGLNCTILKILKTDFSYVAHADLFGYEEGEIIYPAGIETDGTYLYVVDVGGMQVLKYTLGLEYVCDTALPAVVESELGENLTIYNGVTLCVYLYDYAFSADEHALYSAVRAPLPRCRGY